MAEYYLYDPEQDYLDPALQGFRLERGAYRAIEPDRDGGVTSEVLGLRLRLEDGRIQLYDLRTGKRILRSVEEREMRLQAEARAATERAQREAAEAENARLRAEIERLRGGSTA